MNLICVEDGIDSSKDSGKLTITVLSAVAEIERENILVQTMEGRKQKAREGKWNGGLAPFGYRLDSKTSTLVVEPEEAAVVKIIYVEFNYKRRIIILIETVVPGISFELFDNAVCVFGIIFSNESLNTGRIKNSHISFGRINRLADGFGNINKAIENDPEVINKILFEAGDFGSVRDFGKATEFAEWFGVSEKSQEEPICGDRENTLNNQSPQEGL